MTGAAKFPVPAVGFKMPGDEASAGDIAVTEAAKFMVPGRRPCQLTFHNYQFSSILTVSQAR